MRVSVSAVLGSRGTVGVHVHARHNATDAGGTYEQLRDIKDLVGQRSHVANAPRRQVRLIKHDAIRCRSTKGQGVGCVF